MVALLGAAVLCSAWLAPVEDTVVSYPAPHTVPVLLAGGPIANADVITIDWRVLRTLDFRTGKASDTLRFLEKRRVRIAGFIVPLEDFQERAKEFLLVPSFGQCVHLPPPPPNQMVHVSVDRTIRISWRDPVWIEGTLQMIKYESVYGAAGFRMRVDRITAYEDSGKWP
ncbi:DUF3299 domain-containing protein [Gemmatimonas sp.]|uniref:DUF3299 domain-containing protein n=1 Tax=Gemmatimonas sp. TaxID=1962908 RepID=UPI003569FFB8